MQQPQGKRSRLRKPIPLLSILLLFAITSIVLVSLLIPHNTPEKPIIEPDSIPNVGSVSENVEVIQIDQLRLNQVPEINVGGTFTGTLICLLSLALFMIYKKRSQ